MYNVGNREHYISADDEESVGVCVYVCLCVFMCVHTCMRVGERVMVGEKE